MVVCLMTVKNVCVCADVESGDPFAYLTAKSRSMYYVAKDDCRQLLAFKAEKLGEVKEADPLDTELLRFERKHERLVGLEDKAQYAQNAVMVMEERDKMMTSITRKLLDQLGVDIINFETFDISVNSTISNFLAMCNCFNSLSKVSGDDTTAPVSILSNFSFSYRWLNLCRRTSRSTPRK